MGAAKKVKVRTSEKIKVLIADDDWQTGRRLQDFLSQNGFECRMTQNGIEAKKMLAAWSPRILLIDLLLPDANAMDILRLIKKDAYLQSKNTSVIVMSGHNSPDNVKMVYAHGASDYIARPIMYQDLLNRIVFHCRDPREVEPQKEKGSSESLQMASIVMDQMSSNESFHEVLHNITKMAAIRVQGLRCSVVQCVTQDKGVVLASNDRKDIAGMSLDLRKYPEMQLVMNTGRPIVIDNLEESRALSKIKNHLKDITFNALIVCPLRLRGKIYGVISMRMPSNLGRIKGSDVEFVEFVAKSLNLYLNTQDPQILGKFGLIST